MFEDELLFRIILASAVSGICLLLVVLPFRMSGVVRGGICGFSFAALGVIFHYEDITAWLGDMGHIAVSATGAAQSVKMKPVDLAELPGALDKGLQMLAATDFSRLAGRGGSNGAAASVVEAVAAGKGLENMQGLEVPLSSKGTGDLRDCADCPAMAAVEVAGATPAAAAGKEGAKPRLLVAKRLVSLVEFEHFVKASGHTAAATCRGGAPLSKASGAVRQSTKGPMPTYRSPGFQQKGTDAVVCVSWSDAQAYLAWLGQRSGKTYRLATGSELGGIGQAITGNSTGLAAKGSARERGEWLDGCVAKEASAKAGKSSRSATARACLRTAMLDAPSSKTTASMASGEARADIGFRVVRDAR